MDTSHYSGSHISPVSFLASESPVLRSLAITLKDKGTHKMSSVWHMAGDWRQSGGFAESLNIPKHVFFYLSTGKIQLTFMKYFGEKKSKVFSFIFPVKRRDDSLDSKNSSTAKHFTKGWYEPQCLKLTIYLKFLDAQPLNHFCHKGLVWLCKDLQVMFGNVRQWTMIKYNIQKMGPASGTFTLSNYKNLSRNC